MQTHSDDYARIEQALHFIHDHFDEQPGLDEIARQVHLSPFHFQKLFKRWSGISPKRFLQYLTFNHARRQLRASQSLLDVSLEVGLSGSGRLHDLFISCSGMTPGEYKKLGESLAIYHGYHSSPFGNYLMGVTARGICSFWFSHTREPAVEQLIKTWPGARVLEDRSKTQLYHDALFGQNPNGVREIKLLLKGSKFQLQVWDALLRIPEGHLVSYGQIAKSLAIPNSHRAVANAIAKNNVAYLIPCHRVIRQLGGFGGYRWSSHRKLALIGVEAGRTNDAEPATMGTRRGDRNRTREKPVFSPMTN